MAAYLIYRATIHDMDAYQRDYMSQTPDILAAYGGTFVVRGGEMETLEGDPETARVVVIAFPDMASAQAFYHSADYQHARKAREGIAEAQMILVDGV
jgi:uncharacterized protein (DUF1330 family)